MVDRADRGFGRGWVPEERFDDDWGAASAPRINSSGTGKARTQTTGGATGGAAGGRRRKPSALELEAAADPFGAAARALAHEAELLGHDAADADAPLTGPRAVPPPGDWRERFLSETDAAFRGDGAGPPPAPPAGGSGDDAASAPPPARHDGWTPARQVRFLAALARGGNVRVAAARVALSAQAAYVLRRRDPVFAQGWDGALVLAREAAEQVLAERAIDGVVETVFYRGEPVGAKRRFDGKLLLAHLARLDARAGDELACATAARFDELLAAIADGQTECGEYAAQGWQPATPARPEFIHDALLDYSDACAGAEDGEGAEPDGAGEPGDAQDGPETGDDDTGDDDPRTAQFRAVQDAAAATWDARFAAVLARVDAIEAGGDGEADGWGPIEFKSCDAGGDRSERDEIAQTPFMSSEVETRLATTGCGATSLDFALDERSGGGSIQFHRDVAGAGPVRRGAANFATGCVNFVNFAAPARARWGHWGADQCASGRGRAMG
ncbi:hypothetical protein [Novosphingobium lentum]|uniref:hypothetical protein n=1 Tax=Novosphingobium lentum TaxID=145287 RepID=UPI0008339D3B|nr:hypothetical protein [Novosphingobium lentum]